MQNSTNTYLYGVSRIAQISDTQAGYFLPDALGSVRKIVDDAGAVTLTQSYTPYGEILYSDGDAVSDYAFTGEMYDLQTGLVYLRARYYSPVEGRFVGKDAWAGDDFTPITFNQWLYASANPIIFVDPTGYKTKYVTYDRQAAAKYAKDYASQINPDYGSFGGSDCTNFVSQSIKAGGMPENENWFFSAAGGILIGGANRCIPIHFEELLRYDPQAAKSVVYYLTWASFCGEDWAITDNLYNHLISMGGVAYTIDGTIPALSNFADSDRRKELSAPKAHGNVIPSPIQLSSYGNFSFSGYSIQAGDVVFYRQDHALHFVEEPNGLFNHTAFIIDPNQSLTDTVGARSLYGKTAPLVAEHSGGFEDNNITGLPQYGTSNIHSINDTWSEVN